MQKKNHLIRLAMIATLVMAVFPVIFGSGVAHAVIAPQFADTVVRLDNIESQQYTGGTVCIETPASSAGITDFGSEDYVDIGFPSQEGVTGGAGGVNDFTINTTTSNWVTNTYSGNPPGMPANAHSQYWPEIVSGTAAVAWPGLGATASSIASGAPTTVSQNVVRFGMTGLSVATEYCFDWKIDPSGAPSPTNYSLKTSQVGPDGGYLENVPGFVSTYDCTVTCSAPGDGTEVESSNWGTQILANNTIVVSAIVPPIFELTMPTNADAFVTDLNPSAPVATAGVNATVATNAKGGWFIWVKDQYHGLFSASAAYTFNSVGWNGDAVTQLAGPTPGPEVIGYAENIGVTPNLNGAGTTLCTAAATPEYGGVGTLAANEGGNLSTNWALGAGCSTATPPGTDDGTTLTFTELAQINFSTPAASDYTDTIYVTGAGQF